MPLTFELSEPADLLAKAYREQQRLTHAVSSRDRTEIADALFNFAVTAYHIKDWLRESPRATCSPSAVEDYVAGHRELRLCREICNSSKHYALRTPPMEAASVSASATSIVSFNLANPDGAALETEQAPSFRVKIVASDGSRVEVTAFASQVISVWEQFFSSHGLK